MRLTEREKKLLVLGLILVWALFAWLNYDPGKQLRTWGDGSEAIAEALEVKP